jgi:putative NADPH-quinone reductase
MKKKILIILGHPAQKRESFCEVLANAYRHIAENAGHKVKFFKISDLSFDPILHEGYVGKQLKEDDINEAQKQLIWANHIVIVYPLWQNMIPALLKGFFERVLEKGFAYEFDKNMPVQKKMLMNKTAHIIQTSAMPAFMYRFLTLQHAARALKSILKFCGIKPVKITYFGMVENLTSSRRIKYIDQVKKLAINVK